MIGRNILTSGVTHQGLCTMWSCSVAIHSNRRTSGRHPHGGSREDKFCLLQREYGDDEESLPVAGMDRLSIQRELWYRCSSDSGSVMGSSTEGNSATDEGQRPEISSAEGASK